MLKRIAIAGALFVWAVSAGVGVYAQDALQPDTPVTGEITNESFAQTYTYEGTADEVILITLEPVDVLGDYDQPAIVLRSPTEQVLVEYDSFGRLAVAAELPADGVYTITVTRADGAEGLSVGEYTLTLLKPEALVLDEPVDGRISNEQTQYYMYRGEDDFIVAYQRDGSFAPQVSLLTIDDNGVLNEVAFMGGDLLTAAAIGIIPGDTTYIIRLSRAPFSFSFGTQISDYILEVASPDEDETPGEMRGTGSQTLWAAY